MLIFKSLLYEVKSGLQHWGSAENTVLTKLGKRADNIDY